MLSALMGWVGKDGALQQLLLFLSRPGSRIRAVPSCDAARGRAGSRLQHVRTTARMGQDGLGEAASWQPGHCFSGVSKRTQGKVEGWETFIHMSGGFFCGGEN